MDYPISRTNNHLLSEQLAAPVESSRSPSSASPVFASQGNKFKYFGLIGLRRARNPLSCFLLEHLTTAVGRLIPRTPGSQNWFGLPGFFLPSRSEMYLSDSNILNYCIMPGKYIAFVHTAVCSHPRHPFGTLNCACGICLEDLHESPRYPANTRFAIGPRLPSATYT